jgi:23S rRNA (uracil1939-C5)-methyltransferase
MQWQQGQQLEIEIAELSLTGMGVGRWQERVVFVPDAVPGDRLQVRLTQVKPTYAHAQLTQILVPSSQRVRPACIVADKCGGCQWQPVSYAQQLSEKQHQVVEALRRLGKFEAPVVEPILAAPASLGYRNKVTYPLALSQGNVQAGYYRKGSHRLVNLNQCPVQDPRINPFLAGIKQDLQTLVHTQGWQIYNEQFHKGNLRHFSLRIGRRTGEVLLTLIGCDPNLPNLDTQVQIWLQQYPDLVGVCFNHNPERDNRIFGPTTHCLAGRSEVSEQFAGLQFQIGADTFFQIYTEQAEALVHLILAGLDLQGHEQILDAYCGIGTLSLPLAQRCRHLIGLELHPATVTQAQANAKHNQIDNAEFRVGAVETLLPQISQTPDIVILDPPRKGCTPAVLNSLLRLAPRRIVYMSCNPTTLARDLQLLCAGGQYQLERVQPADLFPQTAHVEALAWLSKSK